MDEPIVNIHEGALACFYKTDLDILVIENFIIARSTHSVRFVNLFYGQ